MAGLSNDGEVGVLQYLLGVNTYFLSDRFISLITVDSGETGVSTEVVPLQGPRRQPVVLAVGNIGGAAPNRWFTSSGNPSSVTNSSPYSFANLPAVTVVGWAIWDSPEPVSARLVSAIITGLFPTPITTTHDGTLVLPANSIQITLE